MKQHHQVENAYNEMLKHNWEDEIQLSDEYVSYS